MSSSEFSCADPSEVEHQCCASNAPRASIRPADLVCASELTICARDKLRAKAVRVNTAHFFYLHGGSEIVRVLPLLIPFCNFLGSPNFSQPRDVAGPRFSGAWRGPITSFDARDNFSRAKAHEDRSCRARRSNQTTSPRTRRIDGVQERQPRSSRLPSTKLMPCAACDFVQTIRQ